MHQTLVMQVLLNCHTVLKLLYMFLSCLLLSAKPGVLCSTERLCYLWVATEDETQYRETHFAAGTSRRRRMVSGTGRRRPSTVTTGLVMPRRRRAGNTRPRSTFARGRRCTSDPGPRSALFFVPFARGQSVTMSRHPWHRWLVARHLLKVHFL